MSFKETHLSCPCGKSSDAFAINNDDTGYCFSCGKHFKEHELEEQTITSYSGLGNQYGGLNHNLSVEEIIEYEYDYVEHRNIYKRTYEFFEVLAKINKTNKRVESLAFEYPNGATKVRTVYPEKGFFSLGDIKNATLFGKDKFDPNGCKTITIVEGELDVLSTWQMLQHESAVVSPRSSSSAFVDCKKEWDYINSFDKIVLCLDSDEVGQKAAKEVASLFDFNKVYKVELNRYKDPTAYLEANEQQNFINAWRNCKKYTPDNILSSFHEIEESLAQSQEDVIGTYPFSGLQKRLYGLHRGEVVVFKGEEGIGKTETFRAIEHHLLKTRKDVSIGIIHLEEDEATTVKGIATYEDKYPYIHPEHQVDNKVIMDAYKRAVDNNEGRVYIYESFDVEDETQLLDNIRFLVSACGCEFIFLDHITWLATGMEGEDERKKLDRISQKLKLLAKELRFCLIMISHTNDDGKTRGSRNISKVANTVIHMQRNKVAVDEGERNTMIYLIEKARAGGNTGPAGTAIFDKATMRLLDSEEFNVVEYK